MVQHDSYFAVLHKYAEITHHAATAMVGYVWAVRVNTAMETDDGALLARMAQIDMTEQHQALMSAVIAKLRVQVPAKRLPTLAELATAVQAVVDEVLHQ